jgi:uncharacterized protein
MIAPMPTNTWKDKLVRVVTCLLPRENAAGGCIGCGACCALPVRCPFLRPDNRCSIYPVRPLPCRTYPRTRVQQVTAKTCGFRFVGKHDDTCPIGPAV